jgi:hypothetical protein
MKNSMVGLSVVVTLLCAFLLVEKNREVAAIRARIALADQERESVAAAAALAAKQTRSLQRQLHESRAETFAKTAAAEELERQLAGTRPATNTPRTVSDVFHKEVLKEGLKAEARAGMARNVEALFHAGLAEQLHLNADQSAALRQLLIEKSSILWDKMLVPLTTGEVDDVHMADAGRAIKQELEEKSAQIRALLGDEGYQAYQSFEKAQPDRERVQKFSSAEAAAGQSLTPDQQSQLFAVMSEEHANFKFRYDPGDPAQMNFENWRDNFTEEKLQAAGQDLEQLDERVLQRAQTVLTPDQVAQLRKAFALEHFHSLVVVRTTLSMMSEKAH